MKNIAALILLMAPPVFAQPDRFGLPECGGGNAELADRVYFLVCQSHELRVPVWTAHEMRPGRVGGDAVRPKYFRQDLARNADYRNTGFARGHMVPARDMAWSDAAIRSTFALSNTVPQRRVNSGIWRRLEDEIRALALESDAVWVFTGPVFAGGPRTFIGDGRVAVPTHTFKAVLAIQGDRKTMFAAIVPNADVLENRLDTYLVRVDEVERQTGLDFFPDLDDDEERQLESRSALALR